MIILALLLSGCGAVGKSQDELAATQRATPADLSSLNHIIFMSQENRSFDHYFAKLNDYRARRGIPADVDVVPGNAFNPDPNDVPVYPFHLKTMCVEPPSPSWGGSHISFNRLDPSSEIPTMDGFVVAAASTALWAGLTDTRGVRAMGYFDDSDLPYYYHLAIQFAISDRFFASVPAETFPNRLYMMAATSAGFVHNPGHTLNIRSIFHLLEEAKVSWKVYLASPTAGSFVNYFEPFASQHQQNIVPLSQFHVDLENNSLPAVAMIEPAWLGGEDEHPNAGSSVQIGASAVAHTINALIASRYWKDSVFILTHDESGGFYDHVPPPTNVPNPDGIKPLDLFSDEPAGDFTRFGFRVPLLVVSPFAKPHYVSHTPADFTAVLKLIEARFNLTSLTRRDAASTDMTEYFDFANAPNMNPPAAPTQPTNGPCYTGLP